MATINLGSIKFKWQGAYAGGTAYTVDDVVSYNGSSYICILASTGNLPTNATYFEQMSSAGTNGTDGTDLTTTLTTQGDIVYRDASGLQRLGAGTSGQLLQSGGTGANVSWTDAPAGITEADQWRPTTSTSGGGTDVTAWERADTANPGYIGSGMTHSSGVFTFPSTGIYLVRLIAVFYNSNVTDYLGIEMKTTVDNSTYVRAAISYDSVHTSDAYASMSLEFMFDVEDTSTHKVKFTLNNVQNGTSTLLGGTTSNESSATFIRLGDT
jgi:hypothetical protein